MRLTKKQCRRIKKLLSLAKKNDIHDIPYMQEKKYCNKFIGHTTTDGFIMCDLITKVFIGKKLKDKSKEEQKLIRALYQNEINKNINLFKVRFYTESYQEEYDQIGKEQINV